MKIFGSRQRQYRVEYIKRGRWVPAVHTDYEDQATFEFVANAEGRQYRVLCDGVDITSKHIKR